MTPDNNENVATEVKITKDSKKDEIFEAYKKQEEQLAVLEKEIAEYKEKAVPEADEESVTVKEADPAEAFEVLIPIFQAHFRPAAKRFIAYKGRYEKIARRIEKRKAKAAKADSVE